MKTNTNTTTDKTVETVRVLVGGITIKGVGTVARGLTLKLEAGHAKELASKKIVTIIH